MSRKVLSEGYSEMGEILVDMAKYVSNIVELDDKGKVKAARYGILGAIAGEIDFVVFDCAELKNLNKSIFVSGRSVFIDNSYLKRLCDEEDASKGTKNAVLPLILAGAGYVGLETVGADPSGCIALAVNCMGKEEVTKSMMFARFEKVDEEELKKILNMNGFQRNAKMHAMDLENAEERKDIILEKVRLYSRVNKKLAKMIRSSEIARYFEKTAMEKGKLSIPSTPKELA